MLISVRSQWWIFVLLAAIASRTVGADDPAVVLDADGAPIPHAVLRLGTTAWRHPSCWGLEWSTDGKTLTLNCGICGIRTIDAATGRQIRRLDLPAFWEGPIAISPDRKELAYRRRFDGVMTVDAITGKELAHYPDLQKWLSLQYSPSGKYLVGAAVADVYRFDVVDLKTGDVVLSVETPDRAAGFVFSPDASQLYVAAGSIAQWDLATKKKVQEYVGGLASSGPALSPDGKLLAVGQLGVDIFQQGIGKVHFHLQDDAQEQYFLSVLFSRDGKRLIAASQQGPIYIWDVGDKKLLAKLAASPGRKLMKLSPDDKQIAVVNGNEARIRIWDLEEGKQLHDEPGNAWAVRSIAFSPDGALLATGSFGKDTQVWEPATGQHLTTLPAAAQDLLTFADEGRSLLTFSGHEREVVEWQWKSAEVKRKLFCSVEAKDSAYVQLSLSHDHSRMLRLTELFKKMPRTMEVVEFPAMKPIAVHVDVGLSRSGAISADGKLAAFNRGNDIDLYDVEAQKVVGTLSGHTSWLKAMAFSPDDKLLVSGGPDSVLRVWNVAERRLVHALAGQGRGIAAVAISPNGRIAATCGSSGHTAGRPDPIRHIVLWDLKEDVQVDSYSGHDVDGQALAFSPDGKRLASGLDDGTTIVWETPELAWK